MTFSLRRTHVIVAVVALLIIAFSLGNRPQLTSAARYHGLSFIPFKCQYQASVMKTFDSASKTTVCNRITMTSSA